MEAADEGCEVARSTESSMEWRPDDAAEFIELDFARFRRLSQITSLSREFVYFRQGERENSLRRVRDLVLIRSGETRGAVATLAN